MVVGVGDGWVDVYVVGMYVVFEVEYVGFGVFVLEVEGFFGGGCE